MARCFLVPASPFRMPEKPCHGPCGKGHGVCGGVAGSPGSPAASAAGAGPACAPGRARAWPTRCGGRVVARDPELRALVCGARHGRPRAAAWRVTASASPMPSVCARRDGHAPAKREVLPVSSGRRAARPRRMLRCGIAIGACRRGGCGAACVSSRGGRPFTNRGIRGPGARRCARMASRHPRVRSEATSGGAPDACVDVALRHAAPVWLRPERWPRAAGIPAVSNTCSLAALRGGRYPCAAFRTPLHSSRDCDPT